MKSKLFKLSLVMLLIFASCSKEDTAQEKAIVIDPAQIEPLTSQQINVKIDQTIATTGTFNWSEASNHLLWSAVFQGNKVVTIGFGNAKSDFERAKSSNNAKGFVGYYYKI